MKGWGRGRGWGRGHGHLLLPDFVNPMACWSQVGSVRGPREVGSSTVGRRAVEWPGWGGVSTGYISPHGCDLMAQNDIEMTGW